MGTGKTTLIKAIGKCLGVTDNIHSPTYSIVNEYHSKSGQVIYHFDFYRIKDENEALDMGYEEYFFDNKLCLIEWPSRLASLIPANHLWIHILKENEDRIIELRVK